MLPRPMLTRLISYLTVVGSFIVFFIWQALYAQLFLPTAHDGSAGSMLFWGPLFAVWFVLVGVGVALHKVHPGLLQGALTDPAAFAVGAYLLRLLHHG